MFRDRFLSKCRALERQNFTGMKKKNGMPRAVGLVPFYSDKKASTIKCGAFWRFLVHDVLLNLSIKQQ